MFVWCIFKISYFYAIIFLFFIFSAFDCSLLGLRNTIDFCILVLYPSVLLNLYLLINFFCRCYQIFNVDNHVLCKLRWYYFSLFNLSDLFISVFLFHGSRSFSIILNRSGETGHFYLFQILEGNHLVSHH